MSHSDYYDSYNDYCIINSRIDIIHIYYEKDPNFVEGVVLLEYLRPGQTLHPLIGNLEDYPEQLICENYLDRLLEGHMLEFCIERPRFEENYLELKKGYITYAVE